MAPFVADRVVEALPCSVRLCDVEPTVIAPVGVMVLAVSVPVTLAPPLRLAVPATASVPVKFAELLIVWPLIAPLSVIAPAGLTARRLVPFNCRSIKLPVPLTFVLFTSSIWLVAWLLVNVSVPNVGVAATWIFWMVLTVPPDAEKLVLLNWAIPFWLVEASSMVMVLPEPLAFAIVSAPVSPFRLSTAATPPPPPPLVTQVGQVMLPAESIASGPLALTATVPVALGKVIVLLPPLGVANVREFVTPLSVADKVVTAPWSVRFCVVAPIVIAAPGVIEFTASVPPMVTVVPLSVIIESPIAWLPVNLARRFVVPPGVVTPPPTPEQLPTVVQIS